ncbi:hypothetical protein SEA_RUBYRALPH_35 [Microbacterium phage RubyRalph]|nr:hypothetical protein SEA_RUBYRALPH_35 [Microbacterium phage RubyRalph]
MAYRVEVYESGFVTLIQVGDGHRWIRAKARQIENRARMIAPKRTGRLAASHRTDQERTAQGRYQSGFRVSATVPYAGFVHRGTGIYGPRGARIISRRGKMMGPLPGAGAGRPRFIRSSRGQRPQPWLERAGRSVVGGV